MRMVFRWFGEGNDTVTLNHIRRFRVLKVCVGTARCSCLRGMANGQNTRLSNRSDKAGLHLDVVESVNIHEDIRVGPAIKG